MIVHSSELGSYKAYPSLCTHDLLQTKGTLCLFKNKTVTDWR